MQRESLEKGELNKTVQDELQLLFDNVSKDGKISVKRSLMNKAFLLNFQTIVFICLNT